MERGGYWLFRALGCHLERKLELKLKPVSPETVELDRLVGLVVKASASRAEDPGFESRLLRDFFGVESYQ